MTLGFGRKGHSEHADAESCLKILNQQLSPQVKQALIDTEAIIRSEDEAHVQAVLRRFLIAEKLDVAKTVARLTKHAQWRKQALPKGGIPEASLLDQISQQKVLLQPKGSDGRPLLIIRVARHFATNTVDCENFVTFSLEAASRLCDSLPTGDGKLWALFDLRGVAWKNMDRHALASCFSTLEQQFPERVGKIFMLDAPFIFDTLWKMVSPFVDPHTKEKVAFIHGVDLFLKEVDKSIVPASYGGNAEEVAVEAAVRCMNLCEIGGEEVVEKALLEQEDSAEYFDAA